MFFGLNLTSKNAQKSILLCKNSSGRATFKPNTGFCCNLVVDEISIIILVWEPQGRLAQRLKKGVIECSSIFQPQNS